MNWIDKYYTIYHDIQFNILNWRLSVVLQEEIRVAVNVQLAAHRFMEKKELEDVSSSEYTVSEAAEFKNVLMT